MSASRAWRRKSSAPACGTPSWSWWFRRLSSSRRWIGEPRASESFLETASTRTLFDPLRFTAEERRRARSHLGVPAEADLLTFVGTFGTWHGTDVLATAIRRLIDEDQAWLESRRVHFLYVGDGSFAPRVRSILGNGLGRPFVTLAGTRPQAETPRSLAASDILLSPHVPNPDGTAFFGSPTKLFEYMAMAKPIVASDLDQIGWVLKGWEAGRSPSGPRRGGPGRSRAAVLVEPGTWTPRRRNPASDRNAGRPSVRRCAPRGRRLVLESFTWDSNVAALLERRKAEHTRRAALRGTTAARGD